MDVIIACSEGNSFIEALYLMDLITKTSIVDGLGAAFIFGCTGLILCTAYEQISGRFALGGGDVKLLFVLGLYLGIESEAFALLVACALGVVCCLIARVKTFAFGPYLAMGSLMALIMSIL